VSTQLCRGIAAWEMLISQWSRGVTARLSGRAIGAKNHFITAVYHIFLRLDIGVHNVNITANLVVLWAASGTHPDCGSNLQFTISDRR
jgi:hypothetical protein